ncbi:MAG: 4-hydroxy-tetrahydrodipicolinate reductase [Succiniclasticum sp.]|jgi:4-hydroxy-tetrahydrodipicolinate reductase
MIRVLVNGALGRMGSEVVKAVFHAEDMTLVGGVDPSGAGRKLLLPDGTEGALFTDLTKALAETRPDVVVDFTRPAVVMDSLRIILGKGVRAVVGTTGFTDERLAEVKSLAEANHTAALIAPNFSLGAVVMIKLAVEAAKYFPDVEIIEKHHDQKLDAPSGTAILTAQKIAEVRKAHKQGHPDEKETMAGCRGGDYEGIRLHSMRLPGYVASQEVVFGSQGETLKISNDPVNRECYMPGVLLGCRKILERQGLVYGLDKILD